MVFRKWKSFIEGNYRRKRIDASKTCRSFFTCSLLLSMSIELQLQKTRSIWNYYDKGLRGKDWSDLMNVNVTFASSVRASRWAMFSFFQWNEKSKQRIIVWINLDVALMSVPIDGQLACIFRKRKDVPLVSWLETGQFTENPTLDVRGMMNLRFCSDTKWRLSYDMITTL